MTVMFDSNEVKNAALSQLDLKLTDEQAQKLAVFADVLLKWNGTYNLTSIKNPRDVIDLHLMDSLVLNQLAGKYLKTEKNRVLDVGSGGGLPAIPLAVMRSDLDITMVDAVQKKTIFQRQAIAQCRLKNIRAIHTRIEKLPSTEKYDVITSRAFSSLQDMTLLTRHVLADDGIWLAMKGKLPEEEIKNLPTDVSVKEIIKVAALEDKFERHLIILEKKKG